MKKLFAWIAIDGLLHFLVCYAMMLSLSPILGFGMASYTTALAASLKEAYDYFIEKDNDGVAVSHDFICDLAGYLVASITILVHHLI